LVSHADLGLGRIEPNNLGTKTGDSATDLPFTTTHVQDSPRPVQELLDERKDLLLVLGVGPVGESLLPPRRMLLPERIPGHACEGSFTCRAGPPAH
jgi:hypothetical protein